MTSAPHHYHRAAHTETAETNAAALAQLLAFVGDRPPVTGDEPYEGDEPVQEYMSGRECDMAADRDFAERMGWNR